MKQEQAMKQEQEKIDPVKASKWLRVIITILSSILRAITTSLKRIRLR